MTEGGFNNWFVSLDLMCKNPATYNGGASFYFVGYLIGIIFFWMPDNLGRRSTMLFILPIYVLASALSIFSEKMAFKTIGFFLQGLFHLKITVSYTHVLDLMPTNSKSFVATLITAFDSATPMFACLYFKFVEKNIDKVLKIHFCYGCIACISYIAFIPESPRWLLLKKGSNNK
jgi:MFS family permease